MNRKIAVLGIGAALSLAAGVALAQSAKPLNAACSGAPKITGYKLAKVLDVSLDGELTLDSGSDKGLKDGQSCYFVTCNGERPWRAKAAYKLKNVTASSAKLSVFKGLVNEAKGATIACDTGYNSLPMKIEGLPANAEPVSVMALDVKGGSSHITYGGGLIAATDTRSILPGDKGYVVNDGGFKVPGGDFEVTWVNNRGFQTVSSLTRAQVDSNRMAVVLASNKRCSVSTAEPDVSKLTAEKAPPGYAFAARRTCEFYDVTGEHEIMVTKGADDGVFPDSKVYVVVGGSRMPWPSDVTWVSKTMAKVKVKGAPPNYCATMKQVIVGVGSCK